MASSLPESPANQLLNSIINLQKSHLTSASHFPRSKLHYTPEEYSHWLSLMARDFSLGPSDAPWPVETSTAHGEPSFWEPNLSMGKVNLYGGTASLSSIDHSRIRSNQSSPEMVLSLEASPTVSIRRRFLHPTWPSKPFLGFWLEGLTHKIGPITSLKPKSSRYEPAYNVKNPRLGPIIPLLSLKQCICRFLSPSGRRHQKSRKPYSLFWRCNYSQRILVLASSMADLKYLTIINTYMARIIFVQRIIASSMCHPDLLFRALKRSISDYESLPHLYSSLIVKPGVKSVPLMEKLSNPPSSYMERTLSSYMERTPSSYMERTLSSYMERTLFTRYHPRLLASKQTEQSPFLTFELLCVELFASTKIKVLESSSTSPCQSTMTIISPPELFVEVYPTCHEFTCANLLSSLYTQVFTDHKLVYFIYLYVALGNAFSFHIVNLGISKSLLSLYFDLVCFL